MNFGLRTKVLTKSTFEIHIIGINYLCSKSKEMKAQIVKFDHIIETLYSLPLEDKLEIKTLLEHNIADTRRNEIADNLKQSKEELKSGKLNFTSKIDELKNML